MADPRATSRSAPRLSSGQWIALTAGAFVVAALVGLAVCLVALGNLSSARTALVDRVDPARTAAASMLTALVDEQTGIRGYALSAQPRFLEPYRRGRAEERRARAALEHAAESGALGASLTKDLQALDAQISGWRTQRVEPLLSRTRTTGRPALDVAGDAQLQDRFDQVRAAFATFDAHLAARRDDERSRLRDAARAATIAVVLALALLLAAALAAMITVRRVVSRPLARLADDARRVAGGDFAHPVARQGPRDVAALSADVESMRRRIVADLDAVMDARAQLEDQAVELQRSNAELEQFAYVASHDLQEPLRKVASFCGMLQQRYQGQLDDRADQYIEFAVDGAKRMQVLINDLLAFSRVGRTAGEREPQDMDDVVAEALGNLASAIEDADAQVEVDGALPEVRGDRSLLVALLQNLVGNAVKFRGDEPPRVRIAVEREGDGYRFAVDDNGIGIAPRYADRIFIIFQRLHPKEEYAGTGIGLAMCRKIVEWHGGRIWLEPEGALGGASFRFTLPVPSAEEALTPISAGEDRSA
ncbi:MAG TPA: ATP-binding protein [Baekduia sp.]|nr:ATP-binding protein [Baekduia sp.]